MSFPGRFPGMPGELMAINKGLGDASRDGSGSACTELLPGWSAHLKQYAVCNFTQKKKKNDALAITRYKEDRKAWIFWIFDFSWPPPYRL